MAINGLFFQNPFAGLKLCTGIYGSYEPHASNSNFPRIRM
jgi:hypothetical protein